MYIKFLRGNYSCPKKASARAYLTFSSEGQRKKNFMEDASSCIHKALKIRKRSREQ
jgi:hypothetical protein